MSKFIPREKLSKKARRALDVQRRAAWGFSPVTRKVESKKIYNRKKQPSVRRDPDRGLAHGRGFLGIQRAQKAPAQSSRRGKAALSDSPQRRSPFRLTPLRQICYTVCVKAHWLRKRL